MKHSFQCTFKSLGSVLIVLVLIINIFTAITPEASASGWKGSDFTSGVLADRLDKILSDGISSGVSSSFPKLGEKFSSSKMYTVRFPNRSWSGYQCIAYAYAAYNYLFGNDAAPSSNVVFNNLQGKNSLSYDDLNSAGVKVGAYLRTTQNSDGSFHASRGHSILILQYDHSKIVTLEANRSNSSQYIIEIRSRSWDDFNKILKGAGRYVCALLQPPTAIYANLTNGSSSVQENTATTEITFSGLTTPGNLKEGNGGHIGGYIYSSNSPICSVTAEVYNESGQRTLTASSNGFSVSRYGPIRNSKIDTNLKFGTLPAGTYYIRYTAKTKDGTTATASTGTFTITGKTAAHITHVKGTYLWCEEQHPHYNYYICSLCGEKFTDGSTNYVESCTTCNPVKDTTPSTESNETQKEWGPWSDWSTTEVTPSSTRQVETREVKGSDGYTEYRYGRFVADGHDCWCRTYLQNLSYVSGTASLDYTSWSTTRFGTSGRNWTCGYCNGIHTGVHHTDSNGRPVWVEYKSPSGASYYWEETRTVPAVYETQYRYRDLIQ